MFLGMDFSTVIIFFKNSLFYSHYKVFFFKLFYTTLFMYWKNITRYDMHSEFKLWVGGGGGGGHTWDFKQQSLHFYKSLVSVPNCRL